MYGCSIDHRLMLPRPRAPPAAFGVESALNALALDDQATRRRRPRVRGIVDDLHGPGQRGGQAVGPDVDDVGMRARAMEDDPGRPSQRDLDDLVLPRVR